MSNKDHDILTAEYVLGTLEGAARRRFAERLERDPALRARVETWEGRLESLDQGDPPVEPPEGLWSRIDAALDDATESKADTVTIRADDGGWHPLMAGIEKKLLHVDRAAGTESYLLRLAAGARLPAHEHRLAEECVILEGEASIGDLRLAAGDFHLAAAGTTHPEFHSEHGVLAYIRGEIHDLAV